MSLPVKLGSKPLIKINFDKNVVILEQETGMEPVKTDWFLFKEKGKADEIQVFRRPYYQKITADEIK